MKLSYDPNTDSLYIHLSNKYSVDSKEIAQGVVLDFADDGSLVGLDIQHASRKADINHLLISHVPFQTLEAA
jgi:uncharacterized protein YuzE